MSQASTGEQWRQFAIPSPDNLSYMQIQSNRAIQVETPVNSSISPTQISRGQSLQVIPTGLSNEYLTVASPTLINDQSISRVIGQQQMPFDGNNYTLVILDSSCQSNLNSSQQDLINNNYGHQQLRVSLSPTPNSQHQHHLRIQSSCSDRCCDCHSGQQYQCQHHLCPAQNISTNSMNMRNGTTNSITGWSSEAMNQNHHLNYSDNNYQNYDQRNMSTSSMTSISHATASIQNQQQPRNESGGSIADRSASQTTATTNRSPDVQRGAVQSDFLSHQQQQQQQQQQHFSSSPNRSNSRPREGTKIVRCWDFNEAQFVEKEVPDRPRMQSITSTQEQPDPSWLAYRVPDEQSVQADPLYRDLMFELQRLEEGVDQRAQPSPSVEPETAQQKPVFGQPIAPQKIEVNEYENVEFVCRLIPISDPSMKVEWTVNGRPLLESSRITCEHEFGVARLVIKRCEAEDSGIYQCRAVNSLGEATSNASLRVNAKGNIQTESLNPSGLDKIRQLENPQPLEYEEPKLAQQPAKFITHLVDYIEKNEGESVHLECCLSPVDDPELKTEWFFNGRPLVTGSRFHTIDDFGFIVLDIDWLFPRDTGEYVCRATNKYGQDITRTVVCVKADKDIVLESQLDNADSTIDKLRQLEFPDVQHYEELEPANKPAHFIEHLYSYENQFDFVEGENVHFEARVGPATDGNLTVEWLHNDRPLISGHRFKPQFDFGHIILDILYVYPEDSGTYKCIVYNQQGRDESQVAIRVTGKPSLVYQSQLPKEMLGGVDKIHEMEAMWNRAPDPEEEEVPAERHAPEFVLKPKVCAAFEGSCARFSCRIVANPRPRVAWFINDQLVVSGSRYKLTHDGMYHLTIAKCQMGDAGKVKVFARNLLGECSHETELKVKRKVDDYRSVLKNSPNPWYDEATLKSYRRQRNRLDKEDDDDDEDYEEFLQNFKNQRLVLKQQEEQNRQLLAPNPSTSQMVEYMEPGTPDVNLLIANFKSSPLVEPGDLHPTVVDQQALMAAPAPSTIQKALSSKDQADRGVVRTFDQAESQVSQNFNDQKHLGSSSDVMIHAEKTTRQADGSQQQQQNQRVFGLTSHTRGQGQAQAKTTDSARVSAVSWNPNLKDAREADRSSASSRQQQIHLPPPSPENVEHGKELHLHTHKQTQVERRQNKEITREIIEREIFEQEHSGFQKDNLTVQRNSRERSITPVPQDHGANQTQQQFITIEDRPMVPPEFTHKIQPCQAIDGDEATFESEFRGEPAPIITWYRENKLIKPSNLYSIETDMKSNKSKLTVKRVTLNSNAVFTVKAENAAGSAKSSANLVVEPHPLPESSRGGHARQMNAADHTQSGQMITSESSRTDGGQQSALVTTSQQQVFSSSSGSEQPKVVRSVKTRRLSPDELATMIRASPEGLIAPTFLHTIHDIHVQPGELARFDARLVGSQPMEVRWLKNGQRVRADRGHKLLLEGDMYTLLILECVSQDEGQFECLVSNRVGEARCSATLRVGGHVAVVDQSMTSSNGLEQHRWVAASTSSGSAGETKNHFGLNEHRPMYKAMSQYTSSAETKQSSGDNLVPKVIKRLESQQVREGKSVTLRCQISAYPRAEIFWYKHGDELIKPSRYFRIFKDNDETHCLKILETFPEDQGEYRCMAKTQNGSVETSAQIIVLPKEVTTTSTTSRSTTN